MVLPTVLKCFYYQGDLPINAAPRVVKDYEFDLYMEGERHIQLDDGRYTLEAGSLMIRRPGQRVRGYGACGCYMLTLDFSNTKQETVYSRNQESVLQPLSADEMLSTLPAVLKPRHLDECVRILRRLSNYAYPYATRHPQAQYLTEEFLHLLTADAYHEQAGAEEPSEKLMTLCQFMQIHCREPLYLEQLAQEVHLEKSYLIRLFKKEMHITPMAYLTHLRLDNAKILLSGTDYAVQEIAQMCGFESTAYFCACFKKFENQTPKAYRKQEKQPDEIREQGSLPFTKSAGNRI